MIFEVNLQLCLSTNVDNIFGINSFAADLAQICHFERSREVLNINYFSTTLEVTAFLFV